MKYSFLLIALFIVSCSNPVTPPSNGNQTDPNLLFSTDELMCDFHDSTSEIIFEDTVYFFYDALKYIIQSRDYTKLKITFDFSISDSARYFGYEIEIKQNDSTHIYGDSSLTNQYLYLENGQSYIILFNLLYPSNIGFNLEFSLGLFSNPKHSDYIKLKNIKIYKVD